MFFRAFATAKLVDKGGETKSKISCRAEKTIVPHIPIRKWLTKKDID